MRGETGNTVSPRLLITPSIFCDIIEQMKIIEPELKTVKEEITRDFKDPLSNNALLNFISGSSKRIRSTLAILYIKAHGVSLSPDIYPLLAAGEMIHDASLLQDDVLDEAELRRKESTIAHKFNPKISILSADYLLSGAMEKLLKLDNKEILEIFKDCTIKMSTAEIKQYFLRGKKPSKKEYIEICAGKTASLFEAILTSAVLLSGLDIEKAHKFAQAFGIVFQIKNDMEESSASIDSKNEIYTAKSILGVENTQLLLDNYLEEMNNLLKEISENSYKKALEELITVYV